MLFFLSTKRGPVLDLSLRPRTVKAPALWRQPRETESSKTSNQPPADCLSCAARSLTGRPRAARPVAGSGGPRAGSGRPAGGCGTCVPKTLIAGMDPTGGPFLNLQIPAEFQNPRSRNLGPQNKGTPTVQTGWGYDERPNRRPNRYSVRINSSSSSSSSEGYKILLAKKRYFFSGIRDLKNS